MLPSTRRSYNFLKTTRAGRASSESEQASRVGRSFKLAILLSHPIQYFSPLFGRLARHTEIDLTVLYCSLQGAQTMKDPEFGVSFAWDIPLLDGYRYEVLKNFSSGRMKGFFGCINPGVIRELRKGAFDAVVVFGWGSLTTWLTFGGAALAGMPWMLYGDTNGFYETESHWFKRRFKGRVLGSLFRRTDGFLVSGSLNRRFYESYRVPFNKCFDVPLAVDNHLFARMAEQARPRRNQIRARLGIPTDKTLFLFVGKLIPRKRPEDMLEALKVIGANNPNLAVAYVGEGERRPLLEAQISGSNLNNVFLLGFRNQAELPEIYAMSDALVLPSTIDNKPLVTNEAMACSLPVIVSDRTGVWGAGDIVRDGENGFVYPCGNIGALAEAMQGLAADPKLRLQMGRRSLEIIQDFGYDRCVEGILKALRSVVRPRIFSAMRDQA